MESRSRKLAQVLEWATTNEDVRVVLLTSSLANPTAPVDDFSDLDIELIFDNMHVYQDNNSWITLFGSPISMVEESEAAFDGKHAMKMVLYDDHVKIDFKLYQREQFLQEVANSELPEDWDIGYRVLLDKDQLTTAMQPPTYQSVVIKPPTEQKFRQVLNDFWWDTTYVAKCLTRDEIFYAKFMSENMMRTDYLVPLLEWYIAMEHHWHITTNKHGRLFKKYLPADLWQKVEATFSGSDIEANWQALFAYGTLVHEVGTSLADRLAFDYPLAVEQQVMKYLREVHSKR
ncbi:AadS family aminoglycoside 6-adenylyltransferase [Paraflavitalea pollutisoli]|uniref:AadS family aminoglycoside 6-adenylyltransferase n=1 Tax=Paraflavitalea pollutisoli TaxID=3034143 RepID=UPI0023EC266C|nr:AadS family aminoglycoside 6-adenylyltransferase [Paraflavitalea sp. H1-2-19X]